MEVQSGTLRFANGGTTDSPLDVLASAGLEFSGGTFSLEAGVDMTVPGTVSITGGTLTGAGDRTVEGLLTWSGGTMSGTGKTIADGGMLMSGPGSVVLDGRTIDNSGTAIWDPPIFFAGNGAVFNNTGIIDIIGDAGGQAFITTVSTLNNTGTLRKSGGAGTATLWLSVNNTGGGTVEVQSGTLRFANGYTQAAGSTILNGGDLASTTTMDIQGGSLSGFGTITGNVSNAGQVNPGFSPDILEIVGNYTQTPTGVLNVEVGGLAPGTGFDQLNITGNAALDGTLNISLIGGFSPSPGETFEVMTFSSATGDFAAKNGLDLGFGLSFEPNLTGNNLVLVVVGIADPLTLLESVANDLNTIIQANPNTPLADKTEDGLATVLTAIEELEKTPPDNQAAVGNIEGAVGDLEAAVQDGLLGSATGNDLMDRLWSSPL